jgi:uncharacterized membrane protein YgdD (TMEM256/DUF423 family)
MKKKIIITAAFFGVLAVIAGAFAAHGLQGVLSQRSLEVWHTAVQYQFYHVFALLFLSTITRYKTRLINDCFYLFTFGIVCFSGSLYLLASEEYTGLSWVSFMGPITPIGGLLFIAGWIVLGIAAFKDKLS